MNTEEIMAIGLVELKRAGRLRLCECFADVHPKDDPNAAIFQRLGQFFLDEGALTIQKMSDTRHHAKIWILVE